jgi:hypothetical protein
VNTKGIMCVILIAGGLSTGCTRTVVYKENSHGPVIVEDEKGPPDHAPAHGYRRNHGGDDVELVFDKQLNVYIVSGYRDTYYSAGQYFRWVDGSWEWSVSISTGWKFVVDYHEVPSALCVKHGKGKHHGKHKGHGNDDD